MGGKGSGRYPKGSGKHPKKKRRRKSGRGGPRPGGRPKGSRDTRPKKGALMWKWRRVGGEWKRRKRFPAPVRDYLFSEGLMDYYHVGGGKVSGVWHSDFGELEYILDERLFYGPEERQVYDEIMEHAEQRIKEIREEKRHGKRKKNT